MTNYFNEKNNNSPLVYQPENRMMSDICSFLENVKPTVNKDKIKGILRQKPVDVVPEDREKFKGHKAGGLNDNIQNDFEYKDKARKGLLFLLHKMSDGTVCPNIKDYFKEGREKANGDNPTSRKDVRRGTDGAKSLRRQNLFEKFTNKRDSVNDTYKLNARRESHNTDKTIKNGLSQHMFRKRTKKVNYDYEILTLNEKKYKDDLRFDEYAIFYSDEQLEKVKNKLVNQKVVNEPVYEPKKFVETKKKEFLRAGTKIDGLGSHSFNAFFKPKEEAPGILKYSKTKNSFGNTLVNEFSD